MTLLDFVRPMSTIINHEKIVWLARGSSKSSEEKVFKQGKYYEPALFERNHKLFGFIPQRH